MGKSFQIKDQCHFELYSKIREPEHFFEEYCLYWAWGISKGIILRDWKCSITLDIKH